MKWKFEENGNLVLIGVTGADIPKKLRHMSGIKDAIHAAGVRDFNISLPESIEGEPSLEEELTLRGWRYKPAKTKVFTNDDGTETEVTFRPTIKVKCNLDSTRPPKIVQHTSSGSTDISSFPDIIAGFDSDDIESAAFVLNPHYWDGDGLKAAYLVECQYKLTESPLAGVFVD